MPLSPLTALVGPNGSGKSAVLRAIDLAVGAAWPTLQRLRFPHDFIGYDDTRELLIKVGFALPAITERDRLGTQHHIHGLRVRCRPYKRKTGKSVAGDPNFDYEPYDALGDVPLAYVYVEAVKGRPQRQVPHRVTSDLQAMSWPRLNQSEVEELADAATALLNFSSRFCDIAPPQLRRSADANYVDLHAFIETIVADGFCLSEAQRVRVYDPSERDRRGFWRRYASDPHALEIARRVGAPAIA